MELGGDGGDPPQQHQNTGFFSEGADAALNPTQANARFVPITKNENHKAALLQTHAIRCPTPESKSKTGVATHKWFSSAAPFYSWHYLHYPGDDVMRSGLGHAPGWNSGPWYPAGQRVTSPVPDSESENDETVPDPKKM